MKNLIILFSFLFLFGCQDKTFKDNWVTNAPQETINTLPTDDRITAVAFIVATIKAANATELERGWDGQWGFVRAQAPPDISWPRFETYLLTLTHYNDIGLRQNWFLNDAGAFQADFWIDQKWVVVTMYSVNTNQIGYLYFRRT